MDKQILSNISLKRLRLFSFLIVGTLLAACIKDPEGIGGELVPNSDLISAFETDTVSLTTKLVWLDSVRTDRQSGNTSVLIGTMTDELFGLTSCAANIQLDRLTTTDTIPDELMVDSVLLDLAIPAVPYIYGDRKSQRYRVELLTEEIHYDSAYFGFTRIGHELQNLLVSQNPQEPYATIVENADAKNVLRLKLSPAIGEFIAQAARDYSGDAAGFRGIFKGFRISTEETGGVIARYDMNNKATQLHIHYAVWPHGLSGRKETDVMEFGILDASSAGGATEFFTETTRHFLQSPLEGIQNNLEMEAQSSLLLQSGFVACEVDYSAMQSILSDPHLIVNNVDLVVPVLSHVDRTRPLPYNLVGLPTMASLKGVQSGIPNSLIGNSLFSYQKANNNYRLDVTALVRAYAYGLLDEPTLYLMATNSDRAINRVELAGPDYDLTDRTRNMRLILTYTNKTD